MNTPLLSQREIFIKKLMDLVQKLNFRGQSADQVSLQLPGLTLEQRLCIQLMMQDYDGVKKALELGADPLYCTSKGHSVYKLAQVYNDEKMLELLESYGAKPALKKSKKGHSKN